MERTSLAVIIPTLNAGSTLKQLIENLQIQDYQAAEIIVIDSGSTDESAALAEQMATTLLTIPPGSFDHGGTRNYAAAQTEAEILVFMTQDAMPSDRSTLSKLTYPLLQDKSVVVSYARQMAPEEASPSEKYLRLANYPPTTLLKSKEDIPTMGIRAFQNSNVCAAYKKEAFDSLGGFPAPAVCNEDMIFAARAILAGYKVAYTAEAKVWHSHELSSVTLFKRYFDIAASLDHEPCIRQVGRAGASGRQFFFNQLRYLSKEKQLKALPLVFIETAAKYLGYKCGSKHGLIPEGWKKYCGLNKNYWQNQNTRP